MEGLDIISKNINSSIEAKTKLMDQGNCEHDWIKGRSDYNIKLERLARLCRALYRGPVQNLNLPMMLMVSIWGHRKR